MHYAYIYIYILCLLV